MNFSFLGGQETDCKNIKKPRVFPVSCFLTPIFRKLGNWGNIGFPVSSTAMLTHSVCQGQQAASRCVALIISQNGNKQKGELRQGRLQIGGTMIDLEMTKELLGFETAERLFFEELAVLIQMDQMHDAETVNWLSEGF
jgi:hypothetical protein